ncbi:ATP-dependent RNA helicase DDX51 [Amphibalanus amphitrite]|uniref:ATP-dependent RNA helicase DDX51 n=1 Tax=Amphibalanus amphitrite TaxID=1232801 RepID=A0A6A4WBZ7_AMPAM|nr:ATP-dependent RNA helicase DDX51 [Amphibalanus amphitrite]
MADLTERTAAAAVANNDLRVGRRRRRGRLHRAGRGGALEPTGRAPRALPDWLAHSQPIGDRRPAPANLPALCPELRARLAAEGIEQVFLVQVTVLPELLAAAESPLPPADLCVSAPAGRGKARFPLGPSLVETGPSPSPTVLKAAFPKLNMVAMKRAIW